MSKLLLFLLALTITSTVVAQNRVNDITGKVSGNILDEKGQPLAAATILLLKAADSTLVKSTLSDNKGNFTFDQLAANQYLISVTLVGYQKYFTSKLMVSAEIQSIMVPAILLSPAVNSLKTVTITAQKPLIEMQDDKLVMNVKNSIVATGNTALEVLQKAPGVSLDPNENISLNGKTGILIYIDGKQTYMSQSDLTNLLKSMRSDQIDKIEIISNPSARYDAAGKAIINIITIKNTNFGTNGSVNAGAAVVLGPTVPLRETNGGLNYKNLGNAPRYNASLNLNNREGKVNLFGNFNYNVPQSPGNSQGFRTVDGALYDQYSYSHNLVANLYYKAGLDYFLNDKTTLGVLATGSNGHWENLSPTVTNAYFKNLNGDLQSSVLTTSNGYNIWSNNTFNGNFKHTFDTTGRVLTADIDYSHYNDLAEERGLNTHFFDANSQEYGTPLDITSHIPNIYNIVAAKVDYSMPLPKIKAKLDLGAKSSWVKSDNDARFFNDGLVDTGRSNHFVYTENIDALYGTFSKDFSKTWSLQAGLRMEYTKSEGNSLTLDQISSQSYLDFFPSLFVKQNINANNELSYSYSRRINRPAYNSLNPFIYFLDPYTYTVGNEYLKPSYTDSYGVNYTFRHSLIATFGYSNSNNYMVQVYKNAIDNPVVYAKVLASTAGTSVDPTKITYLTTENLANFKVLNLGITFPVTVTSWWNMNNNFTQLYIKYTGTVNAAGLNYNVFPYNFYTDQMFILPQAFTAEVSMNYNSKTIYTQIVTKEQYSVNLGLRKSFWNKHADLKLSVNDIFATNRFDGTVNTTGVVYRSTNLATDRVVSVNFTYRFGNSNVKSARNRSTADEDERNRVGN